MTLNTYNKTATRAVAPSGLFQATVTRVENEKDVYVVVPRLTLDFEHGPIPYVGGVPEINEVVFVGFLEGNQDEVVAIFPGGTGTGPVEVTTMVAAADSKDDLKDVADYIADGTADWDQIGAAAEEVALLGGGRVMLSEGTFTDTGRTSALTWSTGQTNVTFEGAGRYATVLEVSDTNNGGDGMIEPPFGGRITFRNLTLVGNQTEFGPGAAEFVYYHGSGYSQFENVYIETYAEWGP